MAGLKGKVVLITGASSGIGKGTALHMAGLGCKLSLIGRNLEALTAVSNECKELGSPDVYIASHDLADEKECIEAINGTVKHFGGNKKCRFLVRFRTRTDGRLVEFGVRIELSVS